MLLLQALGSNGSGQLGLNHKEDISTPEPVPLPSSLTTTTSTTPPKLPQIAAGGNHTLLLFSSGDLLSSGDHTTGACGHIPTTVTTTAAANDDATTPRSTLTPHFRPLNLPLLPPSHKALHAAATWTASIIATSSNPIPNPSPNSIPSPNPTSSNPSLDPPTTNNRIYTLGTGAKGELGLGPSTLHTPNPTQIPSFPPPGTDIINLAACMGHVIAVLSNGEAWGWGNGRKGQLGEPALGAVYSPRLIAGVGFEVVKAVCGREFSCLFGRPEAGEMVVLGSDKWGVRSQAPGPGGVAGWKEVGAGWGSVFVLKGDGTLLSWGRDDHGQLAPGGLGRVKTMAVGSEHALALTEAGDLMAWGWGEHGNCGPIRDVQGERGQRNRIASAEPGMEITMLGAGCATSWIALETRT